MIWDDLTDGRIYLDANVIIYAFEGGTRWTAQFEDLIDGINDRAIHAFTSELTLMEVIVKPLKLQAMDVVERYERLLAPDSLIKTLPVDRGILRLAAVHRAELGLKLADSIHVAAAQAASCGFFFSNDARLSLPDGLSWLAPDDISSDRGA